MFMAYMTHIKIYMTHIKEIYIHTYLGKGLKKIHKNVNIFL